MGWNVYKFNDKKNRSEEMDEFEEAIEMVYDGADVLCDLAKEMKSLYGERKSYMRKQYDDHEESEDSFSKRFNKKVARRGGM